MRKKGELRIKSVRYQTFLNLAGIVDVKIKINSEKVVQCYQTPTKLNNAIESGVFENQVRQITLLPGGNDICLQIIKTITSVLLKSREKIGKIRKFLRHSCSENNIEMSDEQPEAPDQSHLLDDTTIPLVDIASSVTSNEEDVIVEAGNDLEKDRENEEAVSTTSDSSPAMVMTMRPVEAEEEVIDLSSDDEN